MSVYSCYTGKNSVLIKHVTELYLFDGADIADVTYGKGAFWKDVDLTKYNFMGTDIQTGVDFTALPYANSCLDVVVLDPPYVHTPGNMLVNSTYRNSETTKGMYHKDIIELYAKDMQEAYRILRKGGRLWVKCQDEIESGKQCYSHIELFNRAQELGFYPKDLFVLQQSTPPVVQQKKQKHARKNHSYLWVFEKT